MKIQLCYVFCCYIPCRPAFTVKHERGNPLLNWRCARRVETPGWHRGTLCIPPQNTCVSRVSRRLDRGALAIKATNVMMNSSEEWRTVKKDGSRCHLFHISWAARLPCEETCSLFWSVLISRRAFIFHYLIVCQCACDTYIYVRFSGIGKWRRY